MKPVEDQGGEGTAQDADQPVDEVRQCSAPRRGFMLILSSPSGAGKTTLTRMLLQTKELDLTLSISVTTRPRRSSEVDGIHYTFITRKQFEAMRDGDELLEWAEVHGNWYGTPREPVEKVLSQGRDVLFDIDYQGTQQVKQKSAGDVVTIFILPPSMKELRARLERRAEDPPDVIAKRLESARNEIRRWAQYDYVLVNRDLQSAFKDLYAILTAERRLGARLKEKIGAFVEQLLQES
jgi:guanylate kinase